ncbi:MAG TPA: 2-oxoacid:acceptor oxidoreductase subunit alpha [Candidatus Binatia bacterium]|nr:2-oxoacid:acceptor oxidoreductase subunit alpha [Candidatus Binatia bacterium]
MSQPSSAPPSLKGAVVVDTVVIRFAGDSGDGMQLTGTKFTTESALAGNDIATLPDFPAEIRAPAGTLAGVSGFQLHFSSKKVFTPGDQPDVLVAMNPAALRVNVQDLREGGALILDADAFSKSNLAKAGYPDSPVRTGELSRWRVFEVPMTRLTSQAVADMDLPQRTVVRCRNFFALGLCSWLYHRPVEETLRWIEARFKKSPALVEANTRVFKAGWNFGETTELFATRFTVAPATIEPGLYTSVTGNQALAWGLMTAAAKSGLRLFYGSYPITPASDILHELSAHKQFGVVTFQAEDEIAAIGAAVGASFGGALGVTASSGPGIALKGEAIGLAVMTELPLVVVNVQRGGPSTGLPTKTEQADLLQALYGRNGECPVAVLAASTPVDCFETAIEAVRMAVRYMTPVLLLSDGYLANGAQPWRLPTYEDVPGEPVRFWTQTVGFQPYLRDEDTLARPWVRPGTPGLEHRIGGIEKDYDSGDISYAPANHERMVRVRAAKIARIAEELAPTRVTGSELGEAVVVGWGSTFGAIEEAVARLNAAGTATGHVHLRWLHPLPRDLGKVLRRYRTVLVPELNMGQLVRVLRDELLIDAVPVSKIQGSPFTAAELVDRIGAAIKERRGEAVR